MSIFTEKDFDQLCHGVPMGYILQDHFKNAPEVNKFFRNFYADPSKEDVFEGTNFMKFLNATHVANGTNEFILPKNNVSIKVIVKKSINNIPQMAYRLDTSPEEDFKNTYPDCNEEILDAIYEFYDKLSCNWAQFLDAWNNSIKSTNDRMYLEFPMCDIPKSNLTLSFPKKYLIGDYDD